MKKSRRLRSRMIVAVRTLKSEVAIV